MYFQIIVNKTFTNIDFSQKEINGIEFENCKFHNCKFIKKNLLGFIFIECKFNECDISNAILSKISFKDVKFYKSKLIGLQFNDCNPLILSFTFFENTNLTQVDFNTSHNFIIDPEINIIKNLSFQKKVYRDF